MCPHRPGTGRFCDGLGRDPDPSVEASQRFTLATQMRAVELVRCFRLPEELGTHEKKPGFVEFLQEEAVPPGRKNLFLGDGEQKTLTQFTNNDLPFHFSSPS